MSRRKRTAEDWRQAVFQSSATSRTKIGLIYMADFMSAVNRHVSRPRKLMARDLGISERTVDRMIADAHVVGLLDTVVHGRKGLTSVYQGTFPEPFSATQVVALKLTSGVALKTDKRAFSATHGGAPVVGTRSPQRAGCDTCGDDGCSECVA